MEDVYCLIEERISLVRETLAGALPRLSSRKTLTENTGLFIL